MTIIRRFIPFIVAAFLSSCMEQQAVMTSGAVQPTPKVSKKASKKEDVLKVLGEITPGDRCFSHSSNGEIVTHEHFFLSYSEPDEQAEWVAYELTGNEARNKKVPKETFFADDPSVSTGSASFADYKHTGYDKGHLAPSADMRFDATAQRECFYMSNMSPQLHTFNAGIWNDLEMQVRYWASLYGSVYVVTGPVLKGATKKLAKEQSNGQKKEGRVTVPDYFYKVIFDYTNSSSPKMIAFIVPANAMPDGNLKQYACSAREVEKRTGIDFFSNLPQEVQNSMETIYNVQQWKWNNYKAQ